MAATIRGAFELVDRASGTLRSIERQALKTQAAVEGVGAALDRQELQSRKGAAGLQKESHALKSFEQDLKGSRREVTNLSRAHDDLGRRSSQTFSRMRSSLRSTASELKGLARQHSTLMRGLRGGLLGLGVAGPVGGVLGGLGGAASSMLSGFGGFLRQKEQAKELKSALGDLKSAFSGVGSALGMLKIPAIVASIAPLISAVDALGGGLLALLPKLVDVGQAMYAVPTGASVLVQAFSAVKLAVTGVAQALQAGLQMQQQWSLNQQQFQQQVVQATDAVAASQMRLKDAIYSQRQAQLQLTVARRDATRELQDMEFQAHSAVLKEARAGLNIRQARLELQQAMMTPGTTQLQIQSDQLAVLEAQASAQQTHTEAVRSRVDYSRALRRDPTSEPVMKVANAQHQVAVSTYEIARAEKGLQRAQYELNFLFQQGNAGVAAYNKALRVLSPAARQFVKFLVGPIGPGSKKSFLQQMQALQGAAAGGLFPPLISGAKSMLGVWGQLETVMHATGRSVGTTLGEIMRIFADPKWILNAGAGNVRILDSVGAGFQALARALKVLILAGQPFVQWLADSFKAWARQKAVLYESARGMEMLHARFDRAKHAIKEVVGVLRNVWDAFRNVLHAARPLGDWMWGRAGKDTGNWKKWTQTHGAAMTQYFNHLKPTLTAIAHLFGAIAKAFVGMGGKQGQGGATNLANTLTKLMPVFASLLQSASAFLPIIAQIFGTFSVMMEKLLGAVSWLLRKVPVLGWLIATAFTLGVVTRFFGKMTSGITGLIGLWHRYRLAQDRSLSHGGPGGVRGGIRGLFSPGTTGQSWGLRLTGRPGSRENPLVVAGLGGSPLNPSGRNEPTGSGAQKLRQAEGDVAKTGAAAGDASKVATLGGDAVRLEEAGLTVGGGGALARVLSKVPGAGLVGKVAGGGKGLLGKAGGLLGLGGDASGLAKFAGMAGKFLGVAGIALSVLPGILSFIHTKGGFGTKLQAGGNAIVSGLSFGLMPHAFGVSAEFQRQQGHSRAATTWQQMFSGGRNIDPSTGLLSTAGVAAFHGRISTLRGQISQVRQQGALAARFGGGGTDVRVIQDRQAQIARLEQAFNQEQWQAGRAAAGNWAGAYSQGIQSGEKPKKAMGLLLTGLTTQMNQLNPMGRRSLQNSMVAWAAQMQRSGQMSKQQVNQLNNYIVGQFQDMGKHVVIINGQILDGSTQQWQQISLALTDPIKVAQEKLAGTFGQIQAQAVGELQAMGLPKTAATALVKHPATASQWVQYFQNFGTSANPQQVVVTPSGNLDARGHRTERGGRVYGRNAHDVYPLGGNWVGGGELVVNQHTEARANRALAAAGAPTLGTMVTNTTTPHWMRPQRTARAYGGYVNPFGSVTPTAERIDQGVDYSAPPGTRLGAIGPGVISGYSPNFYAGQPSITERITKGPLAGVNVYYSEQLSPMVSQGAHVGAGQTIARVAASGTGLELGFANPASPNQPLAQVTGGYSEGALTAAGQAFSNLMVKLGAPGGVAGGRSMLGSLKGLGLPGFGGIVGGKGGGGMASQVKLKVPKIKGIGGIPQVIAQAGAQRQAANLQAMINGALQVYGGGPTAGVSSAAGFSGGGSAAANKALGHRMMLKAGWPESEWPSLLALWMGESGWSDTAMNNPSMGWLAAGNASGIPQSDGNGQVYKSGDAAGQIAWGLNYIRGRYGSPSKAYGDWLSRSPHWYESGGRLPMDAGWFKGGGSFVTSGPTVFGAGEGGAKERVTVEPAGRAGRPINIHIDKIDVHRKGDVRKVVDEEMRLLAMSLQREG